MLPDASEFSFVLSRNQNVTAVLLVSKLTNYSQNKENDFSLINMYTFDVAVPSGYISSVSFSYLSGLKIMIFHISTETQDNPGQSKTSFYYTARGHSFVWLRAVRGMKGLECSIFFLEKS